MSAKKAFLIIAPVILGLLPAMSGAAVMKFTAMLDGSQADPPNDSKAFGVGVFDYDSTNQVLSWNILHTEALLSGAETSTEILIHAPGDPPTAVTALLLGTGQFKSGSADLSQYSEDDICGLINNDWYVTVNTTAYPDGEIRGQIQLVPEPITLGLLAIGGVALRRRRA